MRALVCREVTSIQCEVAGGRLSQRPGWHPGLQGPQPALGSDSCLTWPRCPSPKSRCAAWPRSEGWLSASTAALSWQSAMGHLVPMTGPAVSFLRPSVKWRCRACSQIGKNSQTATQRAHGAQVGPAPEPPAPPASLCPRNRGHSHLGAQVTCPEALAIDYLWPFLMFSLCLDGVPGSGPVGSASLGVPSTGQARDQTHGFTSQLHNPGRPEAGDLFLCGVLCFFFPLKNVVLIFSHVAGEIHTSWGVEVTNDPQALCVCHSAHGSPRAAWAWSSVGPDQSTGPDPELYSRLCSLSVGQDRWFVTTQSRAAGNATFPRARETRGVHPAVSLKRGRV